MDEVMDSLPFDLSQLLAGYKLSPNLLLDLLRSRIDDGMLLQMAKADYGRQVEAHESALRRIRDLGEIPVPMEWVPKEIFALLRWSEPDVPGWKPSGVGVRGHLMRAFACAVLLREAGDAGPEAFCVGEDATLVQLLTSASILGSEIEVATLGLSSWRAEHLGSIDDERPLFPLAILLVAAHLEAFRLDEAKLESIADCLTAEVVRARDDPEAGFEEQHPLVWLVSHSLCRGAWSDLGTRLLLDSEKVKCQRTRGKLLAVARLVLAGADDAIARWPRV